MKRKKNRRPSPAAGSRSTGSRSRSSQKSGPSRKSGPGQKPDAAPGSATGKAKPTQLRVIGGDLRGRAITYHGADFTRPMKDNIRENLFNILGRAVRGAIAFDLFGGTGALAFESLSRGATRAVVVEQNRRAVDVIRKTAAKIGVEDRLQAIHGDAFRLGGELLRSPAADTPWIVFLCPPYVLWEEALDPLRSLIKDTLNHAPPGSVLVAEAEKGFDLDQLPAGDWDIRRYGGTQLAFIEPASRCGMEGALPDVGEIGCDSQTE